MIFQLSARALKLVDGTIAIEDNKPPEVTWWLTLQLGGLSFIFALPDKPSFPLSLHINVQEAPK